MKTLFLLLSGLVLGLWTSWPGIVIPNNWKCFKDIIEKSSKEQISFKAALAVSPNYISVSYTHLTLPTILLV